MNCVDRTMARIHKSLSNDDRGELENKEGFMLWRRRFSHLPVKLDDAKVVEGVNWNWLVKA